jgi:predicted CXXCH cytochrome family protein
MSITQRGRLVLIALIVAAAAGCSDDEKIVYRDADTFNPPPDATNGFLGYFQPTEKLTSCGNCHVGKQAEWEGTVHANAYASLEGSGHAQSFCYGCHTVSENGNALAEAGGYNVTPDPAYHDVQCESCHGAGLAHVENPDSGIPLPSLDVILPADGARAGETNGCGECHTGTHHPFAEEWAMSAHASPSAYAAGREDCAGCHRGQGVLEAWGVDANYLERDASEHLAITCGVCHDPHGSPYAGQLRFPINTVSAETHLCARCHDRRTVPDPTSSHGLEPHSPETALLLGDAGWFPPNLEFDQGDIVPTHGTGANAGLCAACHVAKFTVNDAETGEFAFQSTGHLFTALPCLDAEGLPTTEDCGYTVAERSFLSCATAGCHGTPEVAEGLLSLTMNRIESAADDLLLLLETVDAGLEDADEPIDPASSTFTLAEGALFNYHLATFGGGTAAGAAHNPFLVEALLDASIVAMTQEYNLSIVPVEKYRQNLREVVERSQRAAR